MARKGGNPDLKPGPGRPKGSIDKDKREVVAIFREAAPGLLDLAIKRATGYEEVKNGKTVFVPGDNNLLKELVKKALPDNINLGVEDQTIKSFMAAILAHRPPGAAE